MSLIVVAKDLAPLKAAQIARLTAACGAAIAAGFASSALGAPHTYPMALTDQANMQASFIDATTAPPAWVADTAYALNASVMAGATRLLCTVAGVSGTTQPAGAGADGTASWAAPWTTPFKVRDAAGQWRLAPHSAAQIQQAAREIKAQVVALQQRLEALAAQVAAATTADAIQAVTW